MYIIANELYHHGVKGQKWGVRRADRLNSRGEKKIARSMKADKKILAVRAKNRAKLANKYGEQSEHVKDFDRGTKYVKSAMNKYNKTIKDYYNQKSKAALNSNVKYSDAYKDSKKRYRGQQFWDSMNYGISSTTKYMYAMEYANMSNVDVDSTKRKLKAEKKAYKEAKKAGR